MFVFKIIVFLSLSVPGFLKEVSFCYGPATLSCTTNTLTCPDGEVLSVRIAEFGTDDPSENCQSGADVCNGGSKCCRFSINGEKRYPFPSELFDKVQHTCSHKPFCNVDITYDSSTNYTFTRYIFDCIKESNILSMVCKDDVTTNVYAYMFYFGDLRRDSLGINCSCTISSEAQTLTLYTQYIQLDAATCPSFSTMLSDLQLPPCNSSGLQETYRFVTHIQTPVTLKVENLLARTDDIFWVQFLNTVKAQITVSCTGCGIDVEGACGRTEHIAEYCYGAEDCSQHRLECKDNQKIGLTSSTYFGHRPYVNPNCEMSNCNRNKESKCCRYHSQDALEKFEGKELEDLNNECTLKQSCVATPQYREPGSNNYAFYRYDCIPESSILNAMKLGSKKGFSEGFINYNGSTRTPATTIDCSCRISSPGATITVNVYALQLHPDTCCKLNISSSDGNLPETCTEQSGVTSYSTQSKVFNSPITVAFHKMASKPADLVFVRFSSGKGIDIDCGGCTETTDAINDVCSYHKAQQQDADIIPIAAGSVIGVLALIGIIIGIICACKKCKGSGSGAKAHRKISVAPYSTRLNF
ncbi:uncharacterized protein LOC126812361 isoform X1 [Patella vulgata]|uniref:uncharacterized protein LOC126812361 isoform X1 n=1 Tax=Patella vulgata TaxID=6465 RepID=UPI0024A973B5|nr:uncharacterized protein LOC126812361 isoform X1 [Patella vulgata]